MKTINDLLEDIEIEDKDIHYEMYPKRPKGAGGQHCGMDGPGVKITHLPTDITVICQKERSHHKNHQEAFLVLKAYLIIKKENNDNDFIKTF